MDALRGIAALGVVLFHATLFMSFPGAPFTQHAVWVAAKIGAMGVDIFFVISGICITLVYRRSRPFGAGKFWKRRWVRLWPTFAVSAILFGGVFVARGQATPREMGLRLVENFGMLPGLPVGMGRWLGTADWILPVYWTLAYEAQFYLAFPLLVHCWNRFGWYPTNYVAIAISVAAYLLDPNAGFFMNRFFQFMIGCQLCDWFQPRVEGGCFSWKHLAILNGLMLPVALSGFRWHATLLAQVLVGLLVKLRHWRGIAPLEAGFARVGVFSYTLYLYHEALVSAGFDLIRLMAVDSPMLNAWLLVPAALAISLAGAWVMFQLVERHFI